MRDFFYKYYSFDGLEKTLSNTSRKWSSPSIFNDPFENTLRICFTDTVQSYNDDMVKQFKRFVLNDDVNFDSIPHNHLEFIKHFRSLPINQRKSELNKIIHRYTKHDANYIQKNKSDLINELNKAWSDRYIFCVTENHNNLLMWSHYADGHKGGVLKLLPIHEVDSPLLVAKKIIYSDTLPRKKLAYFLNGNRNDKLRELSDTALLAKNSIWSYEREWRVITTLRYKTKKFELFPFAPQEIGALYLGCRMEKEQQNKLIEIMHSKYPWAHIYLAQPKEGEFALEFTELKND